jgi:hypothetical protein
MNMKTKCILFLLILATFSVSYSQSPKRPEKVHLGLGSSFVSFIDYYYLTYGDVSVYTYLPSGLCFNVNVSKKRHTGELGVLFGNNYNRRPSMYIGYNFRLSPENWKLEVLAGAKLLPFYSRYSYQNLENQIIGSTNMLGGTVQYKVKKWKFGISYYTSPFCYQLRVIDKNTSKVVYKNAHVGFQRLGTIMLNLNYSIN